jgi:hypothetical protein
VKEDCKEPAFSMAIGEEDISNLSASGGLDPNYNTIPTLSLWSDLTRKMAKETGRLTICWYNQPTHQISKAGLWELTGK